MERKILVVDDDPGILQILEETFQEIGCMVRCAQSAEEALEILEQEDIQVMFLDLKLPGMSGTDLAVQIRNHRPTTILYALSGHTELIESVQSGKTCFDECFGKPFEVQLLFKAAQDAFEKLERQNEQQV